ncbi:MAG: FxsA family protein [Bacillota bacterium]
MFAKLLLIFAIVPLIELALLIKLGGYIGLLPTILLVGGTGVIGVTLARKQGYHVVNKVKASLDRGEMPTDDLIGGLLILIGGAMLLTPGLITDVTGFSLIIPGSRNYFVRFTKNKFRKYIGHNYMDV